MARARKPTPKPIGNLAAMCIQPVLTASARVVDALWRLDASHPETTHRLEQALDAYPPKAALDARA